ncbi:MAG TPA: DNA gyrase inhibitor YacG [Sphingomicrobium sp.]
MPRVSKPCPVCRKSAAAEFAPFCSARCKDRDLLQWLGDGYAIPGPPIDLRAKSSGWTGERTRVRDASLRSRPAADRPQVVGPGSSVGRACD